MAVSLLEHLAARSDAPVFVACGPGALDRVEALRHTPGIRIVETPRAAAILLVAGDLGEGSREALMRVHDQMAPPRATLCWAERCPIDAVTVAPGESPVSRLRALWVDLLSGRRPSAPDLLPDAPPNPWRGLGDRGHGGEGMMGGVPYGRPMAMPDDDLRDGLMLDAYTARFGPFLPMWPPGLRMELTLQGDVIVNARILQASFAQPGAADTPLACAARLLRLTGPRPLADRISRRATKGRGHRGLLGAARLAGAVRAIPPGLGRANDGSDVRARFERWLTGETAARGSQGPIPFPAVQGLEWHEAALVLNSLEIACLRDAALAESAEVAA